MSALMLVLMPEHRLICPISKNRSPDAHLVVRNSNVLSMEKLPLLVHGKAITDQGGEDNVGSEHRLQRPSEQSKSTTPAFPDRGRVSSKQHSHEVYHCADNNCPGNDEEDNCNYPNSCCSHCLLHYDWVSRRRNAMQKTRQERVTNTG